MAVRKKKRTVVLQEITEEERLGMIRELEKDLKELREAGTGTAYTMDDIRRAIEEARSALEDVGEFDMELEGDEYVIRLSRHVNGKIKYDPRTEKIFIILPDDTKWRQDWDGHWDRRSLGMHINIMVMLHESRQKIHWLEEEARRLHRLSILSGDARQQEMASHLMGVVHGLLQTAHLITKTDCSRCLEWPLAAITGSFRHPAGVFSCRLGREDRPKLAGACLIRRRCAASPTCRGNTSDLYSPGAVRPRYCGILRRLQARVPAYEVSRTGHDSAA